MLRRSHQLVITGLALGTLALGGITSSAEAQFGKRMKDALKRNAEDKAIQKAVSKENEVIDSATSSKQSAEAAGQTPGSPTTDAAAPAASAAAGGSAKPTTPAEKKVWANYDFVPGQRTLFYSDFTDDQVGNFPQRLEFEDGSMEVVEIDGKRALKASSASSFTVPLPEVLPEKYTIEIDLINRDSKGLSYRELRVIGGTKKTDLNGDFSSLWFGHAGFAVQGVSGGTVDTWFQGADSDRFVGKPASFRVLGDGKYVKLYADEKRLANIPNANFRRDKGLYVTLDARDDEKQAVYITRIRVAESQRSVYEEISSKGRWATQGILFATGQAEVKPESAPTLRQIAAMLKEHGDLKLEIQGHTDNVGRADANLKLSEARAAAVKAALVGDYGVDAEQLTTRGYGDTKPVVDNKTAEARANNRRVELVKK
jgi:OmpA-OmpF porin, OOP family